MRIQEVIQVLAMTASRPENLFRRGLELAIDVRAMNVPQARREPSSESKRAVGRNSRASSECVRCVHGHQAGTRACACVRSSTRVCARLLFLRFPCTILVALASWWLLQLQLWATDRSTSRWSGLLCGYSVSPCLSDAGSLDAIALEWRRHGRPACATPGPSNRSCWCHSHRRTSASLPLATCGWRMRRLVGTTVRVRPGARCLACG